MDWRAIDLFKGIDLNDSFVLDWNQKVDQLTFEIEASIWPDSKYYRTPKSDAYTCYRRASLIFASIKSCTGLLATEDVQATNDPDGSKDYGNIDSLESHDGSFTITGEFGVVVIQGGELRFDVHT